MTCRCGRGFGVYAIDDVALDAYSAHLGVELGVGTALPVEATSG